MINIRYKIGQTTAIMKVRIIEENDITRVAELFDAYRVFYKKEPNLTEAQSFIEERFKNKESKVFVCENEEGNLIGFTQLYPLFSSTRMKKSWLLNDLFVDPEYRGKGASIRLIEKAKELVRDTHACGMSLETHKSNIIGNRLYPKTGFELNKTSNFYEWSNQ